VLIKNAEQLLNYNKGEEEFAESIIKAIADSGVNVVVVGGSITDILLHYLEKYRIMVIRIHSKFELRRVCKCLQATALVKLSAPTAEEVGHADLVEVQEIGSVNVTVFKRETKDCKLATIVLRGSTTNFMDDIERALDDIISNYRNMLKD
jgi:T-complex protein 1 subunit theta